MAKTVVGLFDTFADAQGVVQDLIDGGFRRDDISLVSNDARNQNARQVGADEASSAAEGAGAGAVGGTVVGGVLGLLVGAGLLAIPGIGPVLAAGPLAAALGTTAATVGAGALGAGIGAAAGGLLGGLIGAGVPEEDANFYAEGVRRGGTLVTVNSSDEMAGRAHDIMQRHGAVDINDRGAEWREGGWSRFDPDGEPMQSEAGRDWQESSKAGTAGGTLAGAATGAAIGAAGGPVGSVVGGIAGAATGAGAGAAGDVAGERAEDADEDIDESSSSSSMRRGRSARATSESSENVAATRSRSGSASNKPANQGDETVLPVVEEELRVGKRAVEQGKTRVTTHTSETPVEEQVTLREERVNVERRPANRPASEADMQNLHDQSFEITETAEEAVVSKQARVIEEVVIGKDVQERTETVHDTVRRTDVDVQEVGGERGYGSFDNDFRSHYQSSAAGTGYSYQEYSPVYRYGYSLATDPRYQGRDWSAVETDARRRWEERNPNTWDQFKDSVHYAWDKVRGRR